MIIGVDPHKTRHTATATNAATNTAVGSLRVDASVAGYRQLLRWARQFGERQWAVENARGLGCHLSQWLVAQDEIVLDASVVVAEDNTVVFALLEERRANLAAQRVRSVNQLHALLRDLIPGGAPRALKANTTGMLLRRVRPKTPPEATRKALAWDLDG